ncbi:acyl-[acyl-carrier-protein] thioesterase [Bradyrhizobium sp. LTSP849]|uniref:acyl-CoA thioesterase n=1 Tax=Bradyrhizobium sp. LTSP849 TaxID=1615890 RepID=UPI0005D14EC4|nr:acyl-[acyl-carrier-protein] thioesterase [Bradyrhizobium sp. LTSP849]
MDVRERWITYRGAVDAWECDQMLHMNIQHFARRIGMAERYLLAQFGLSSSALHGRQLHLVAAREHIAFAKELRAGCPIVGRSVPVAIGGNHQLRLQHELINGISGDPCMTACSEYALVDSGGAHHPWPEALVQAIDAAASQAESPLRPSAGDGGNGIECGRCIVSEDDCQAGDVTREVLVRLANHAGSHVGLEKGRQWEDGRLTVGSATLHLTIERHAAILPGTMLQIRSALTHNSGKIVHIEHHLLDAVTGREFATMATAHVFFDVASRKAIAVPDGLTRPVSEAAASPSTLS